MHYSRLLSALILLFLMITASGQSFAQSYDERFTLESRSNKLYLRLKLPPSHRIYGPVAGDSGLPTKISFEGSNNLAKHDVTWPEASSEEYMPGIVNYVYNGDVEIPLYLEAIDNKEKIGLRVTINYVICSDQCVPVTQVIEQSALPSQFDEVQESYGDPLYLTIFFAFIGGLILNFMPCVLPVLALKLMSVIKGGVAYKKSFFITTLGIMSTFWALALISIIAKNAGTQIGIGMGFQESEFIIFLCILITIFISISLDKTLVNFSMSGVDKAQGMNFMSGVIATLLSIPCTAPFLGGATLVAVTGDAAQSLLIFTFMGLGFSLPYLLLIASPNLLRFLPKPGNWMIYLKKILAILFIASLAWLLGVLYGQLGLRATAGLFLLLLLIKFVLEQENLRYKILLITLLAMASLYLPQTAHNEDQAGEIEIEKVWHEFDRQKIGGLVAQGKIVVVDVTADWCLTCKFNKLMVWDRNKTVKLLSKPDVVAMRVDITKQDKSAQSYLQELGVYGIPFDVVYGSKAPKGVILPTLLKYDELVRAIEDASGNKL